MNKKLYAPLYYNISFSIFLFCLDANFSISDANFILWSLIVRYVKWSFAVADS